MMLPPARPTISRAMISLWPEPNVWMISPRATDAPRIGASFAMTGVLTVHAKARSSLAFVR